MGDRKAKWIRGGPRARGDTWTRAARFSRNWRPSVSHSGHHGPWAQGRELIEGSSKLMLLLSMAAGHLGSGHVLGTKHEGGAGVTGGASKIPFGPTFSHQVNTMSLGSATQWLCHRRLGLDTHLFHMDLTNVIRGEKGNQNIIRACIVLLISYMVLYSGLGFVASAQTHLSPGASTVTWTTPHPCRGVE